jgi:NADPH:quinone reductase-like Zn-dependent oxidoreductase
VNYLTAYQALTRIAKLQKNQKVLISGATGSVGHAVVQVAKALGGHPIAVVSSSEKSVVGYSLHAETDEEVSPALIELRALAAKGQLKPVIDSTVSIEDFERGYSRLASRKAVGSVILRL